MKVNLNSTNTNNVVNPYDMKDGDLGVIVKQNMPQHIGKIVQKSQWNDILFVIGGKGGACWKGLDIHKHSRTFLIRPLEVGEMIEVV